MGFISLQASEDLTLTQICEKRKCLNSVAFFSPTPSLENCFRLLIEQAIKQHGSHENPPPDLAILTLELNAANSDYHAADALFI